MGISVSAPRALGSPGGTAPSIEQIIEAIEAENRYIRNAPDSQGRVGGLVFDALTMSDEFLPDNAFGVDSSRLQYMSTWSSGETAGLHISEVAGVRLDRGINTLSLQQAYIYIDTPEILHYNGMTGGPIHPQSLVNHSQMVASFDEILTNNWRWNNMISEIGGAFSEANNAMHMAETNLMNIEHLRDTVIPPIYDSIAEHGLEIQNIWSEIYTSLWNYIYYLEGRIDEVYAQLFP